MSRAYTVAVVGGGIGRSHIVEGYLPNADKFKVLGPRHLYLALSDGSILETTNGGKEWKDVFRP